MMQNRLFSLAVIVGVSIGPTTTLAHAQTPDYKQRLAAAMLTRESDGLHKAAQASGGTYVAHVSGEPYAVPQTLKQLVAQSDKIFTGTFIDANPILSDMGRSIETCYKMSITRAIVGVEGSEEITLCVPGGSYKYSDGTSATIIDTAFKPLQQGINYLFFAKMTDGLLRPAGWNRGIYELNGADELVSLPRNYKSSLDNDVKAGLTNIIGRIHQMSPQ